MSLGLEIKGYNSSYGLFPHAAKRLCYLHTGQLIKPMGAQSNNKNGASCCDGPCHVTP